MKSSTIVPGICCVRKLYHSVLLLILKERGQTQAEACQNLGISVTTFQKYLRLKGFPNFRTPRGKVLAQRMEKWSTVQAELLFPEAFFTKEFLAAPKTDILTQEFRLIGRGRDSKKFPLLPAPSSSRASKVNGAPKQRKKKRKANWKKRK